MDQFLGMYVTFQDIFEGDVSREALHNLLAPLDKGDTLLLLSIVNQLFANSDSPSSISNQGQLAAEFFDPQTKGRILKILTSANDGRYVVVHRHQLLYLMKETLIACSDEGMRNSGEHTIQFLHRVGRALLMASSLLPLNLYQRGSGNDDERRLTILAEMLPVAEYSSRVGVGYRVLRARYLTETLPRRKKIRKKWTNTSLSSAFRKATGLSLRMNRILTTALATKLLAATKSSVSQSLLEFAIDPGLILNNTKCDPSVFQVFLRNYSIDIAEYSNRLKLETSSPQNDFTTFRRFPFVRFNEGFVVCLDIRFLLDKMDLGVFWQASKGDPEKPPEHFRTYLADLFEIYVNELWKCALPDLSSKQLTAKRLHPDVTIFKKKGQDVQIDGVIDSSPDLVLMEYKSGVLPANAKYEGSLADLSSALQKRLGIAAEQLAARIQLIAAADPTQRGRMATIDLAKIKRVFPLVVVLHPELSSILTGWYLDRQLRTEMKSMELAGDHSILIMRPVVMNANELELLVHHTGHTSVVSMLLHHIQTDSLQKRPFAWSLAELLEGKEKQTCFDLDAALKRGFDEMTLKLFGEPVTPTNV